MCDQVNMQEEIAEKSLFTEPRRLHPVAILFNLIKLIKEAIFGIGAGMIIAMGESKLAAIIIVSLVIIILLLHSFLRWYRFTYRVENNELRIEHGVFIRKKRYISKNRIHTIDLTASVIHRLTRLVKVEIDTAGSEDGAEASLSAVPEKVGEQLREELKSATNTEVTERTEAYPVKNISWKRLFIAGTTSGSAGVILTALIVAFSQIEDLIPENLYDQTFAWIIGLSLILISGLIIFVLFIIWLLGIAGTMIKYGNFSITKQVDELFITRGLLEKKQLTIPINRIQAIGVEQSIIRQPFGFVKVYAVVAGGSIDQLEEFPILFPILKEKEVESFLQTFLLQFANIQQELIPLPKRARKYYLFRATIPFALLLLAVGCFFPSFTWIPLILLFASSLFGILRYKDGGYLIEGERIILRRRLFNKVSVITFHKRIQAVEKSQHKIQAYDQLATVEISLLGSSGLGEHYALKDLAEKDASRLFEWCSYRTSSTDRSR